MVRDPRAPPDDIGDDVLVKGVRAGDDAAWAALIRRHHTSLVRVGRLYVSNDAAAADIAQDTWSATLAGLDQFEGQVSFKTWLFRTLINQARGSISRDARRLPFSSTTRLVDDDFEGAIDSSRLKPASDPFEPLHWASFPSQWEAVPQRQTVSGKLRNVLDRAINDLSVAQREVVTLRDVLGWGSSEVADVLGITEIKERVLLHRARSRVRNRLEEHLTT